MWQRFVVGIALMLLASASLCAVQKGDTNENGASVSELIDGDDFRDYISRYVQDENAWAQALRTFGSLHKFMHEVMTAMARHGALERGDTVPEFEHSISGQKWRDYREVLSKKIEPSLWRELVHNTERMYERVHDTMVRAVIYDAETFGRELDLGDYLGAESLSAKRVVTGQDDGLPLTTLDEFRELVWNYNAERKHWHSAMQQALVFAHMLDNLLTQWLVYGATHDDIACRPAEGAQSQRGLAWADYVQDAANCDDANWRELVQAAGLMHTHVYQMLHLMASYRDWSVPTSLSQPFPLVGEF